MTDLSTTPGAAEALAAIPVDQRNPTFSEPWEAQAFALTLALHRKGVFTWNEWAATLGEEIKRAQAKATPTRATRTTGTGSGRSNASSRRKGITTGETLHRYQEAWDRAADRTPHGEPIVLQPADLA
jgi:hypothetical protein